MPSPLVRIKLGDLVDEIKQESKLQGSSDLNNFVLRLINELLLEYCLKNRYYELLQLNIPFNTTKDINIYPLPDDLQHISLIRYTNLAGNTRTLYSRNEFIANPVGSSPRYYQVAGNAINLMPSTNIYSNEIILLDYYSVPAKMTDLENDFFPIPRLYGSLKQRAIYRALKYNAVATADSFKADAAEEEARVRPNG